MLRLVATKVSLPLISRVASRKATGVRRRHFGPKEMDIKRPGHRLDDANTIDPGAMEDSGDVFLGFPTSVLNKGSHNPWTLPRYVVPSSAVVRACDPPGHTWAVHRCVMDPSSLSANPLGLPTRRTHFGEPTRRAHS